MLKLDTAIHTASDNADTALTTANAANSAATSASTTASTALSTAQSASTTATQAQTTAETALTNSGAAQSAAENAETAARANTITNLAPAYDPSLTYDVGDLVTYIDAQGSGKMYKCIVAITTPEAFNINKWDDVTASVAFKYADKTATFNSTGGTTSTGDLFDWLYSVLSTVTDFSNVWLERTSNDNSIVTHWRFTDFGSNIISLHNIIYNGANIDNNFFRIYMSDVTQSFINTSKFNYLDGSYSRTNDNYGTTAYSSTSYNWTLHY
jgi:hypothetical protein